MNLHALRLFHTVASTGSVTVASEQLKISQPSVTAQIKNLERELGFPLLKPQGRGVVVTEIGKEIALSAKRIFMIERQIEQLAQNYNQGTIGSLKIAATYLPAHFLIPAWLAQFKQQYEQIDISVTTTNSSGALKKLLDVEVDIAIYGGLTEEYPDSVFKENLFEDELWFVVAPQHRYANQQVSLSDIVKEPFVMREEGSSTRERLFSLCRTFNTPAPIINLQFNGLHEVITAVVAGYGANFVSSLVVRDYVERGLLARVFVEGVNMKNIIAICTRNNEELPSAVSNFIEVIRSV